MKRSGWVIVVCCVVSVLDACERPGAGPMGGVRLSVDAADRLGKVARGVLVDSGEYHEAGLAPDSSTYGGGASSISFTSHDRNFSCTGGITEVTCSLKEASFRRRPDGTRRSC